MNSHPRPVLVATDAKYTRGTRADQPRAGLNGQAADPLSVAGTSKPYTVWRIAARPGWLDSVVPTTEETPDAAQVVRPAGRFPG